MLAVGPSSTSSTFRNLGQNAAANPGVRERKKKLKLEMSQFLQQHLHPSKPVETNNLTLEDIGKPISDLRHHVDELSKTCPNCREGYDGFDMEFEELRKFDSKAAGRCGSAFLSGSLPQNSKKNRYRDILPNESTRVKLGCSADSDDGVSEVMANLDLLASPEDLSGCSQKVSLMPCDGDYINANWVNGGEFGVDCSYIATQAPLPSTFVHFWRMVWENKCSVVVVLSSDSEIMRGKVDQYWPEGDGVELMFGDLVIESGGESAACEDIFIRILTVFNVITQETRTVHMVHYSGWPDQGVPQQHESVLSLLKIVDSHNEASRGPVVVHCSAGVGRTGAYCCIDLILKQMKMFAHERVTKSPVIVEEFQFNIFDTIKRLKVARTGMVQQKEQYVFCYKVILEAAASLGLANAPSNDNNINSHITTSSPSIPTLADSVGLSF